jgi:hypothetical protein
MTCQPGVRFAAIAPAVSMSALAPMHATADDLFVYRSEDGRFIVDLPAEPPSIRALTASKFSITKGRE